MEKEIKDFRISSLFWKEFFQRHHKQLTLYIQKNKEGDIVEFNNIDDLLLFDSYFLNNVDSEIIFYI